MPAPHEIIPTLEGLSGFVQTAGDIEGTDSIALFIEVCKLLMRQPKLRNKESWVFYHLNDVDQTGVNIYTGTCWAHALLYRTTSAAVDICYLTDNTTNTPTGGTMDADDMLLFEMQIQAQGTWRLGSVISLDGIYCGTGITLSADAVSTSDPGTDDNDCFILYRTD